MVLELKVPEGADWAALRPIFPVFSTYVLVALIWLVPDRRIETKL